MVLSHHHQAEEVGNGPPCFLLSLNRVVPQYNRFEGAYPSFGIISNQDEVEFTHATVILVVWAVKHFVQREGTKVSRGIATS